MISPRRIWAVLALPLLLLATTATAQPTADDIIRKMASRAETQMANVDNFVVTTRLKGLPTPLTMTTYYQRSDTTELPYMIHTETIDSTGRGDMGQRGGWADPLTLSRKLQEHLTETAQYKDTTRIDGEHVDVLAADDVTALYGELVKQQAPGDSLEVRNARFYVDADESVLRKVTADLIMTKGGTTRTVKLTKQYGDYRKVGAMRYPYQRVVKMDYQLSDREKAQLQKKLTKAEALMQALPEAKRKKIGKQLEALRALADGNTTMRMMAEDVEVNTDIPAGTFK